MRTRARRVYARRRLRRRSQRRVREKNAAHRRQRTCGVYPQRLQRRERAPCPKKRRSIIQVCYLTARKHVDVSLAAVARLCRKYDGISFTVVGSGVERAGLEKLAHELGLDGCVEFAASCRTRYKTMARMAQSEIFLLPSVDEGFGIAYIEAMASGCVAIGTQGREYPPSSPRARTASFVPPLDADAIAAVIARCFDEPEYASGVAKAARAP